MDEASTINADQDRLVGVVSDLKDLLGNRLQLGVAVRDAHGHDESWHETHAPDAVAFAASTEEVAQIVKICAAAQVPVIAFGTGTSLEGQVSAVHGGVTVDLS
ncbi:MAG: FAD-binding protein, partial [Nitratireductor sp.]